MRPNIFVSYSHSDSSMVAPVVALLRASQALVFRDADGIRPGKKWRNELAAAITEANVVVVFWCHHAQSSDEVWKEFTAAVAQGKDVLPLLIDDTPLPHELAEFQYIDFREAFALGHSAELMPGSPSASPMRRSRVVWLIALAVAAVVATSNLLLWQVADAPPDNSPSSDSPHVFWLLILFGGLFLSLFFVWRVRRRKTEVWYQRGVKHYPVSTEQEIIAKTVEAELIRRTGVAAP